MAVPSVWMAHHWYNGGRAQSRLFNEVIHDHLFSELVIPEIIPTDENDVGKLTFKDMRCGAHLTQSPATI